MSLFCMDNQYLNSNQYQKVIKYILMFITVILTLNFTQNSYYVATVTAIIFAVLDMYAPCIKSNK